MPEAYTRHRDPLHNPLQLHPGTNPRAAHRTDDSGRPCFADEVGRAVLRATKLALHSQTLLDRDTSRLLNTLTNPAQLFHRQAKRRPILDALVGSRQIDEDTEHPAFPAGPAGQAA